MIYASIFSKMSVADVLYVGKGEVIPFIEYADAF